MKQILITILLSFFKVVYRLEIHIFKVNKCGVWSSNPNPYIYHIYTIFNLVKVSMETYLSPCVL